MKYIFGIFKIKREERLPALIALIVVMALNAITIMAYYDKFKVITDRYFRLFVDNFHLSGYDPLTYSVVSNWTMAYNIYRHPLLAWMMYVPYQFNHVLMQLTGINCVQFVVAAMLVFCSFYSFVFLYRIMREVIEVKAIDAFILSFLHLSFAYVMVASMAPDHFVMSMFMLVLTLYVCGKKMKRGKLLTRWQQIVFFFLTAGISLNNGIKTFLAALFTNRRKFFSPGRLLLTVVFPSALIWFVARQEYHIYEYPNWKARQTAKKNRAAAHREKVMKAVADTMPLAPVESINAAANRILKQEAAEKEKKRAKKPSVAHQGKPIKRGEFWDWTDATTSRWLTVVENLMGESIQLHQRWLLGDTLRGRPVIVHYRHIWNYIAEGMLSLLILCGIWMGRRSRFMWMALSFFGFDMLLHLGAGFGINEIYIMSPHWMFAFPIAIAYLLRGAGGKVLCSLRMVVAVLAIYLFAHNGYYILSYMAL
jgi:hypothetical protein